jgi:hypothetical protein
MNGLPDKLRAVMAASLMAFGFAAACESGARGSHVVPEVSSVDVHRFVVAWKRLDPSDSTCTALAEYLRQGSPGLNAYRQKFEVTQADLCTAVRHSPSWYSSLESKLGALDSVAIQIRAVYANFAALHPTGKAPSVYFIVGNGIAGGTITGGSDPLILIGMELNRSVAGISSIVAHELVHTQQRFPFIGAVTGGPSILKPLRGTVLRHSIKEGSANFIAELLTGEPHRNAYGEAHEAQLWEEFQREANTKDYSRWVYNGWNKKALGDRPADLGYWVGYRITKSYFDNASDKQQAIRDILSIRDFNHFLEVSKYSGGKTTQTRLPSDANAEGR